MRIIEQLVYKITGDNTGFDKSIDKSEGKVTKFGGVADKIFAGVTVAAIAASIKKLGDLAIATSTALDRVDKMSQKIGISRTAFQEWDFILSQSGASVDGLQMGVKTLSNAAAEAKDGVAEYKDEFDKLGVSVTDVDGKMKDQETLFNEVFIALSDMENQTERTAIANRLLGRSATELSPAFNAGGDAIEEMRTQAHELGLVMGDELVDQGVVLTDNIDKLKRAFAGWKNQAIEPILGVMVTLSDKMLGQDSSAIKLEESTLNLAESMQAYKDVTEKLNDPIGNLTESEKALLEIQQQRISLQVNRAIAEVGKNYEDTQRSISNLKREEEGYQKTIDESLAIINSYSEEQREEIDNYQQQTSQITPLLREKKKLKTAQENLEKAQLKLLETQSDLIEENASFESSLLTIANAVINGQVEISTLANINENFAESVRLQVEELQARDKALANAKKEFENLKGATDAELKNAEELLRLNGENTYSTELLRLVTEELTKRREAQTQADAEAIKKSEELEAQRQAEADAAVEAFNTEAEARKSAYESMEESRMTDKEKAFKAIQDQADEYLKAGVSIKEVAEWQAEQIAKYREEETAKAKEEADKQKALEEEKTAKVKAETDARNKAIQDSYNERTQSMSDAYKLLESYRQSDYDKEMQSIQEQADAFLKAGVSIVDVAKWQKEELAKLNEEQADKAKEEAERARDAWIDYAFDVGGSIASMWGSINKVQSNAHKSELQRMEEEGATEEELQEAKKQFAIEDLKRKKAQGTFQAIIDTASAVIGFLANPGGFAGVGLSAMAVGTGAAQIAAIQSEPLPSFDVGSIRIPDDTQAVVHRNEMILPAPIAEQARQEGVTIAPSGGNTSVPIHLVVELDGRVIGESTVRGINAGQYGKISARVVK